MIYFLTALEHYGYVWFLENLKENDGKDNREERLKERRNREK